MEQVFANPWGWLPLGLFGLISWSVWLVRRTLSHRPAHVWPRHLATTSLVVPVYREDPAILLDCLRTWIAAGPTEILLVVDVGIWSAWPHCGTWTCLPACGCCPSGTPGSAQPWATASVG